MEQASQGCKNESAGSRSGTQVCIDFVEPGVGTWGGGEPQYTVSCPSAVSPGSTLSCWFNFTSTSSYPQNLTNLTVGGLDAPFTLRSLSDPLPATMSPGGVLDEKITIGAPASPGHYSLLLHATFYSLA